MGKTCIQSSPRESTICVVNLHLIITNNKTRSKQCQKTKIRVLLVDFGDHKFAICSLYSFPYSGGI